MAMAWYYNCPNQARLHNKYYRAFLSLSSLYYIVLVFYIPLGGMGIPSLYISRFKYIDQDHRTL